MKTLMAAVITAEMLLTAATAHAWTLRRTEQGAGNTTIYHITCNNGRWENVVTSSSTRTFVTLGRVFQTLEEAAQHACGE